MQEGYPSDTYVIPQGKSIHVTLPLRYYRNRVLRNEEGILN